MICLENSYNVDIGTSQSRSESIKLISKHDGKQIFCDK